MNSLASSNSTHAVLLRTDSHTCTAGEFGQFATGIGNTDASFVLGTGKILLKVPPTMRFILDGEMPSYLQAKDLILHYCEASITLIPDALVAPNPSVPEMLQAIMARFIQQVETNKATNDHLATLAAALGILDGENDRAETARRRLFATTNPNLGVE
ncbi:hypothetical protein F2Q69_00040721 [Brassica cretica]|uniref:Aconitase/3-isopropylmalate dehydratase large subunit alpha/beta/alpha domain-containing protein n=1 Tax=Brassica cretica TaxID=69181 RepID=A0A8S9NKQ4_BRACR|nr:hypothetical protein F2Q69_00040721 [Brassica cretica]